MAQHQHIFLIAKIKGRYRALCSVQFQWPHGFMAIKRCLSLLNIFEDLENRLPIEQELLWLSRLSEDILNPRANHPHPYIPFPFIYTCLTVGASFDLSESYYQRESAEAQYKTHNNKSDSVYIVVR